MDNHDYYCDSHYKKILIIDDEPFILDIFSQFLSDVGYDIQSALSNDEAIKYAQHTVFDLILLDVHMKGIGFSEFIAFFKKTNGGKYSTIPIIAVTGMPDAILEEDRDFLSGVLEKPFTPDALLSSIRSVIDS